MKKFLSAMALAAFTSPVWAAMQTVTLSLPGMNCVTCPITVKKALNQLAGVSKIEINLSKREAQVTFDDAMTSIASLTNATKQAGYPSTVGAAK